MRSLGCFAALLLLFTSGAGWANTQRFPAFDLWPVAGERNFFSVSSSQGLYRYQYSFDLSNSYALHTLETRRPDGTRLQRVIDYYFGQFFSGSYGVTDFWQVGLTLPVFSQARFQTPDANVTSAAQNVSKVGDLRLVSRIRFRDGNRYRWGASVEPFMTIPLGSDESYLGETAPTGGIKVIGDFLITDRIRLALNGGPEFRGERVTIGNINFLHRFRSQVGLAAKLGRGITVSGELQANTSLTDFYTDKASTPVEYLAGGQWEIGDTGFTVGLGGGSCFVCGVRGADARFFANVGYRRLEERYVLKEREEEEMRVVTLAGRTAEAEKFEIYELVDKCPLSLVKFRKGRDDPRCPEVYEMEKLAELCPENKAFKTKRDNPRCLNLYAMQRQDTDRDGVADFQDRCPAEKGKKKADGCPKEATLAIAKEGNQITTEQISFDSGKSLIKEEVKPVLDTLVRTLRAQPAISLLSIEGHADRVGSPAKNQAISTARARSVYRYLIEKGINPKRLTFKGFGGKKPIADNKTDEGRTRNRRVEFVVKKVGNFPGKEMFEQVASSR